MEKLPHNSFRIVVPSKFHNVMVAISALFGLMAGLFIHIRSHRFKRYFYSLNYSMVCLVCWYAGMLGMLGRLSMLVKLCCFCENISIINLFNRITIEFVILVLFRLVCLYPELVCIWIFRYALSISKWGVFKKKNWGGSWTIVIPTI